MQQRRLGRTGLKVSEICLGTMTFAGQSDAATGHAILDAAAEQGVTFIDTADCYPLPIAPETAGKTEEVIGDWFAANGRRDEFVLATKCRIRTGHGPNDQGLSRRHILRSVELSLTRLKTDYIDLYQAHSFDPETPIDETLRAFDDLVKSGKVRYIGCSNYPAWQLALALGRSEHLGLARYDCLQPRYNLLHRDIEPELLPLCRDQGIGVISYNPLAGGLLTGKYAKGEPPRPGTRFTLGEAGALYRERYWQSAQFEAVETLKAYAESRNVPLATLSVAWVLAQPGITSAIVGASRPDQLVDTINAVNYSLDDDAKAALDSVWWTLPRRPVNR